MPYTYVDLVEALARYVHRVWYKPEPKIVDGETVSVMTFDNACSSAPQIMAGILLKVDILRPLDDIPRRCEFTCDPREFRAVIAANAARGCDRDVVVMSLIDCIEFGEMDERIASILKDLDILERIDPEPSHMRRLGDDPEVMRLIASHVAEINPDMMFTDARLLDRVSRFHWTDKKAFYDQLGNDWPSLIA